VRREMFNHQGGMPEGERGRGDGGDLENVGGIGTTSGIRTGLLTGGIEGPKSRGMTGTEE